MVRKRRDAVKKILKTVLLVFCFVGSVGVSDTMAQSISVFMHVPGINGSSVDSQFPGWIELLSLTQTLQPPQQGKPNPQCFLEVTKGLDASGPLLWAAAVVGQVFGEVEIDLRKTSGAQQVVYKIKLRNAIVTTISTAENGGTVLVERVTWSAASVQLLFYPQKPDGSLDNPIVTSFAC
jgi:type VI secretion system Hcp family effector